MRKIKRSALNTPLNQNFFADSKIKVLDVYKFKENRFYGQNCLIHQPDNLIDLQNAGRNSAGVYRNHYELMIDCLAKITVRNRLSLIIVELQYNFNFFVSSTIRYWVEGFNGK